MNGQKGWNGGRRKELPRGWCDALQTGNRLDTDMHAWHLKVVLEASEAVHTYRSAVLRINQLVGGGCYCSVLRVWLVARRLGV